MLDIFSLGSIPEIIVRSSLVAILVLVAIEVGFLIYLGVIGQRALQIATFPYFGIVLLVFGFTPLIMSFLAGTSGEPEEFSTQYFTQRYTESNAHWTGQECLQFAYVTTLISNLLILTPWMIGRLKGTRRSSKGIRSKA